jgi:hypothetical protein
MNDLNDIIRRKWQQMAGVPLEASAPCSDANPVLWALFCARTNRDRVGSVPTVWTEADVVSLFLSDFAMREADLVA